MSEHGSPSMPLDAADFERDVVEVSKQRPVIVDFWAEWCQPCRILGPILDKIAEEYGDRLSLVKIETERAPEIAAGLQVRSIPAVFGFRDGKIIDSFVGVLPEKAIRAWVEGLFPSQAEALLAEAQQLEETDPEGAELKYREAIDLEPTNLKAKVGLAHRLLARESIAEARAIVDGLTSRELLEPEGERLKTELSLRTKAEASGDIPSCRQAAEANPKDLQARYNLALALAAHGEYTEALDICLDLVERNKEGLREPARKTMVEIFQVLNDPDVVSSYQRQLASALF